MNARDAYRRALRAWAWLVVTCTALFITLSGGNSTEWGWLGQSIAAMLRGALA